ncbi:MAG: hypothetical protein JOY84_08805 [Curvibacter sp.]|nr:hypothetical protein [Curvibacter sp.]
MTIAARPPVSLGAEEPSVQALLRSALALLLVFVLALGAALIHIQTRPVEPVVRPGDALPAPTPSAPFEAAEPEPAPAAVPAIQAPPQLRSPSADHHLEPAWTPKRWSSAAAPEMTPAPGASGAGNLQGVYGTQPACAQCGWVESVTQVQGSGLPAGAAMAAGAALGARAGSGRVGTGSSGTTAGSTGSSGAQAAGAAAGAVIGASAAQSQEPAGQGAGILHEIRIRMQDGSLRVVRQTEALPLGAAIVMDNGVPRLAAAGTQANTVPAGGKVYGTH